MPQPIRYAALAALAATMCLPALAAERSKPECFQALRQPGGARLTCDHHAWMTDEERADLVRLTRGYLKDARCVVSVDIERRFVNEARAIRRLKDCPNVVEVEHMTQSEDGHLILVMEHISGGDLAGLMASRQLSVDEVIEFQVWRRQ